LAAWNAAHQLDHIEAHADSVLGDQLTRISAALKACRESVFRALDQDSKDPVAACRQMLSDLSRSEDPELVNPIEYRLVASERAPMTATSGLSPPAIERSIQRGALK
jgi:hypothetical protein